MKVKKLSTISDLKRNIDFNNHLFVIDVCQNYCFLSQDAETAMFFHHDDMIDYVIKNIVNNDQYKTFLFDCSEHFSKNCFHLKSWFYVNGYNSLMFIDSLYGHLEDFILKDRAKISSIFFKNYKPDEKNFSFELINLCIPVYKQITQNGLKVEPFDDVYYERIKKFIDKDGVFHPQFTIINEKATRVGSVLHSFPRKFRKHIKAKDGCKIVELDYNAAEARIIEYLTGDKKLKKSLKDDVHVYNAKLIFGEDVEIEEKHRDLAKIIFFGWINGLNINTISKSIDIEFSDTRALINKLKKNYQKIVSWSKNIRKKALKERVVVNKFGRKRSFASDIDQNESKASRQIFSFIIQSTFTDIKLAVMLSLYKKFPNNIVGEITDSIILEFKDDENFESNIDQARKIIENPFENKVYLPTKMIVGEDLGGE